MPLVLSMKPGQDFYVGGCRMSVGTVNGRQSFDVHVDKTGVTHCITEDEAIEVLPDVFISSGPRLAVGIARVAIDAPREVTILRGDRYREGSDG